MVGLGLGLPGFMPLRRHGFFVCLGFGLDIIFFLGIGFFVGFGFGFMALSAVFVLFDFLTVAFVDLVSLAIGCTDFVDLAVDLVVVFTAFEAVEAIAVPVKRKAAAVIDASSFFKMCSSFP